MDTLQSIDTLETIAGMEKRSQRKVYRSRGDPFSLNDEEFRKRYRFKKSTAHFIVNLVRDDIRLDSRGSGTSPEIQVLTAIRCWGRREYQEDAGDLHGLSQATTSRICARVARALARHSNSYIKMPSSFAEEEQIMRQFSAIRGFPTVIGCIDCTHIKIRKCGGDAAQYYINRKGYYSLNVQVTCDVHLRILDIVARWRGSTHDSRIFNECSLKERFERGSFRGRLLGDSGYKLQTYLFTPILNPQSRSEKRYNKAHIATRNTVERCFGVWKQRFQCLLFGMTCKLENVKTTIVALAVLHNIAIDHGDMQIESSIDIINRNEESSEMFMSSVNANAVLQTFIRRHFS